MFIFKKTRNTKKRLHQTNEQKHKIPRGFVVVVVVVVLFLLWLLLPKQPKQQNHNTTKQPTNNKHKGKKHWETGYFSVVSPLGVLGQANNNKMKTITATKQKNNKKNTTTRLVAKHQNKTTQVMTYMFSLSKCYLSAFLSLPFFPLFMLFFYKKQKHQKNDYTKPTNKNTIKQGFCFSVVPYLVVVAQTTKTKQQNHNTTKQPTNNKKRKKNLKNKVISMLFLWVFWGK